MNEVQIMDEKSLQLVVTDERLGSLTTNAEKIRDLVKSRIGDYTLENYNEGNLDKAKADKALLNKAKKALNDERIRLEKSFMQPFMGFKDVVNETVKLIDTAVKGIDSVVKAADEKAKNEKRDAIGKIAEECKLEEYGIKLSLIFNDKWLNKTCSLKKVKDEINAKMSEIGTNLATLRSFGEDYEVLATRYKENLDLNATIAFANQLKAQREAKAQPAPQPQEAVPQAVEQKEAEIPKDEPKAETVYHEDDDAFDAFADALGQSVENTKTHVFTITGTEDEIAKVVDFLNDNNITFEVK